MPLFRKKLGEILHSSYELSNWLIKETASENFVREIFLDCANDDLKYVNAGLLITAIDAVAATESTLTYAQFLKVGWMLLLLG